MTITRETPRDLRKKLRRAESSRDSWKEKHRKKQYEIKKLTALLTAARDNRDEWRYYCKTFETKVMGLEQALLCLQHSSNDCSFEDGVRDGQKKSPPHN